MQERYILKTLLLAPAQMAGFFPGEHQTLTRDNVVLVSIAALSGLEQSRLQKNQKPTQNVIVQEMPRAGF